MLIKIRPIINSIINSDMIYKYYDIKIKKEVYEKSGVLEYIIIVDPGASYCIL